MADTNNTYTNIKDILKQFELQIVQQKHYTKAQTYSKSEVDSAIGRAINGVNQFNVIKSSGASDTPKDVVVTQHNGVSGWVGTLEATSADAHTIYFVPKYSGSPDNYAEYMVINNVWEKIGDTSIDLSGYVPKTTTVNGHDLSDNVTVSKSDVGLGKVANLATDTTITSGSSNNITSGAVYSALNATLTESSSKGVKISGKVNAPTITVTPGSIANNNDSVVTGGAVYTYAQPKDADLTAITALTGTSGFLKKTAENTWSLDESTYLTTGTASNTYTAKTKSYSSTSAGVKLGGTSESPTITVTGGSIEEDNTSVVTGGTVYNYAQPKDDTLTKIAALGTGNSGSSYGLLRRSPVSGNIWTIDNTDYASTSYVQSRLSISDSEFTTMLSEV